MLPDPQRQPAGAEPPVDVVEPAARSSCGLPMRPAVRVAGEVLGAAPRLHTCDQIPPVASPAPLPRFLLDLASHMPSHTHSRTGSGVRWVSPVGLSRSVKMTVAAVVLIGGGLLAGRAAGRAIGPEADNGIRRYLVRRAARQWNEDFHSGGHNWQGDRPWTVEPGGYVRPAGMALFTPSRTLTNYRLQFRVLIESRGIGWIFRARDRQNYQAVELREVKSGPRPVLSLIRYAVVQGAPDRATEVPLQVMVHDSTPFEVVLDVSGDEFSLLLDGEQVDHWTDPRLRSGGVGFFSSAGSTARLYWMQLFSNNDALGQLCGFLTSDSAAPPQTEHKTDRQSHGQTEFRRVRANAR